MGLTYPGCGKGFFFCCSLSVVSKCYLYVNLQTIRTHSALVLLTISVMKIKRQHKDYTTINVRLTH